MCMSREHVLKAIDETKADLMRLPHQIDADEFKLVMLKSYGLVALLEKLIADLGECQSNTKSQASASIFCVAVETDRKM